MTLTNNKNEPEEVYLKQVDYKYLSTGENYFVDPATLPRSNASWIRLNNKSVVLKPGETRDIIYSVRIPQDTPNNASYSSAILVEPQAPAANLLQNDGQITLQVKVRYAHQLITTLGQPPLALKLLNHSAVINEGKQNLNFDVENVGQGHLAPKLTLKLFDLKGNQISELNVPMQNILAGSSVRFTVPLPTILKGDYIGLLLFDAGDSKIFGEKILLSLHEP